ncbi:hypothetical protein GCK72_008073 [Caenorhabditis remanei]|uniref:PAN-3 domain-containing protein n=1 Tax=Caenorhabditis remanei TaxID=31234 RepID=A0A6A5HQN7_CAERE|nr:hypothetical protein GCK72_008073 [Caenorhabditis remanei]KAF1768112.1 hypothetical protein GCK72_008073 [Caenorhabditis remanei]
MVMFNGTPDPITSYPTSISWISTGTMCAEACEADAYLGDVVWIEMDVRETDQVAFKIQEDVPCAQTAEQMFQGITNSFPHDPIESYELVVKSSTSYEIQYKYTLPYGCQTWVEPVASCQNCPITMMSFRGIRTLYKATEPTVNSWTECMYACYMDDNCFLASMTMLKGCSIVSYGYVISVVNLDRSNVPTSSTALNFLAIKYVPDNFTCNLDFDSIWNKPHTLKAVSSAATYTAYRPITSGTNMEFMWIPKGLTTCESANVSTIEGVSGCYTVSVSACTAIGSDGLMTIPNEAAITNIETAMTKLGMKDGYYTVGLTRDTTSSPWKWTLPELVIDASGEKWCAGQPGASNLTYTYLKFFPGEEPGLYPLSAIGGTTGTICHIPF